MATKTQPKPAPKPAARQATPAKAPPKPAPSRAVAKAENKRQEVATYDYGAHSGAGAEDISKADFLIPFVRYAQSNSPQTKRAHEKYIAGCVEGSFFNVNTGRVYCGPDDSFDIYVIAKQRYFGEFIPRDEDGGGGGFVGTYPEDDPLCLKLLSEQGRNKTLRMENGNDLVETYALYAVVAPTDAYEDPELVVMPFSSTGITPVKQLLMSMDPMLKRGVPIYAMRVSVSTRQRVDGNLTWVVPVLKLAGEKPDDYLLDRDDPMLALFAEHRAAVAEGRAKADHASDTGDGSVSDIGDTMDI